MTVEDCPVLHPGVRHQGAQHPCRRSAVGSSRVQTPKVHGRGNVGTGRTVSPSPSILCVAWERVLVGDCGSEGGASKSQSVVPESQTNWLARRRWEGDGERLIGGRGLTVPWFGLESGSERSSPTHSQPRAAIADPSAGVHTAGPLGRDQTNLTWRTARSVPFLPDFQVCPYLDMGKGVGSSASCADRAVQGKGKSVICCSRTLFGTVGPDGDLETTFRQLLRVMVVRD